MARHDHARRPRRVTRETVRRVLVVAEGERTEIQYVERLDAYLRSKGATAVLRKVGLGKDPLRVVRRCIEERDAYTGDERSYDVCVCLVDVDTHANLLEACALAEREGIHLLVSNLKFEVWLRWHAEDKRSALGSKQLDAKVAQLGLTEGKALTHTFPIEAVDIACKVARSADPDMRASRVGPDPSTSMPILVEILRGGR